MCGITGIFKFQGQVEQNALRHMTDLLAHRGPDGEDYWIDEQKKIGLGHRRLSIIDLDPSANQPMQYADGRYIISFNGEIYNYIELKNSLLSSGCTFTTNSDTEVLLAMYHLKGKSMLSELEGMFSFVIWDNQKKILFGARDRFGEKPFYYNYSADHFVFASEIKSLFGFGVSTEVNKTMIANYLFNDLVINPMDESMTFYASVKKLPKSSYFEVSTDGRFSVSKYYTIQTEQKQIPLDAAAEEFRRLLSQSVERRLRSDVRVGSSLSGGLDSSAIVCTINRLLLDHKVALPNISFSARFKEKEYSEDTYLDAVVNHFKLENESVYPTSEILHNELQKVFYHQEEPFLSTSILNQWAVMRLAQKHKTTVLLDGQGADELLGGYTWYNRIYLAELHRKSKANYQEELDRRKQNGFSFNKLDFSEWIRSTFNQSVKRGNKYRQLLFKRYGFHGLSKNALWFGLLSKDFLDPKSTPYPVVESYKPDLNSVLLRDHSSLILEPLLRYADRNSMAFGREVRLPYLDHKLVDFCFSLPSSYKISHGWQKFILRKAFDKKLPDEVTWRKSKMGFAAPEKDWLNDPVNKDYIWGHWEYLQKKGIIKPNIPLLTGATWKVLMLSLMLQFSELNFKDVKKHS